MSDSLLGKLKQTPDPGDVFWLLKKKDVDPSLCSIKSLRDKAFNHPVLVLSIDQRAQIADVLIVSFDSTACSLPLTSTAHVARRQKSI